MATKSCGIIVHSLTGNTLSVANRLRESFLQLGFDVTLEQLNVVNENPNSPEPVQLGTIPDPLRFDLLVIAGPVRGMSMSPAIKKYLETAPRLSGTRVLCFVTHFFPFSWMGGNGSVKQMADLVEQRGGTVVGTGVVDWSSRKRDQKILDLVSRFSSIAKSQFDTVSEVG